MTSIQTNEITYRYALVEDAFRLSLLFQQVYIHTYAIKGISKEFAEYIEATFTTQPIITKIQQEPTCMIIAEYKGNFVGVAEIQYNKKCPVGDLTAPELHKLYILESFTRLGIGHKLMQEVEKTIVQKNYKKLWLWVYLPNERAHAFYQKLGYSHIGNAFLELKENSYENKVFTKNL